MEKRVDNVLTWDEYFMGLAHLSALRSKDPNTQVGAAIVDENHRVVSVGYNGFPTGVSDDEFPWEREGDKSTLTKYPYVCHAELNAILNAGGNSLKGCRIYVALFPCNECAKAIIQCGIKEVVYISDKYKDTDNVKASKKMFEYAGVKLTHFESNKKLTIDFNVDTI